MTTNQCRSSPGTTASAWPVPTLDQHLSRPHRPRPARQDCSPVLPGRVPDSRRGDHGRLGSSPPTPACIATAAGEAASSPSRSTTSPATTYTPKSGDQGSPWDADLSQPAERPHGLYLMQQLASTYGAAGGRRGWDHLVHHQLSGRHPSSAAALPAGPRPPTRLAPSAAGLHKPGDPAPDQGSPRPAVTCWHVPARRGIMVETPPVRRRLLGAALRRYREGLGYRSRTTRPGSWNATVPRSAGSSRGSAASAPGTCETCSPSTASASRSSGP